MRERGIFMFVVVEAGAGEGRSGVSVVIWWEVWVVRDFL